MPRHRFVIDHARMVYPALVTVIGVARENLGAEFDFGPFDDEELRQTHTIEVVGQDGVIEVIANRLLDADISFEVGESDGTVALADTHATGGVSLATKQDWLVAHGKPKSWSYFATSGTLGPGWDWQKAVSGGYSEGELEAFFTKTDQAYAAHKSKGKAAKTPTPKVDIPLVPGSQCAKTAAKAVLSTVGKVTALLDSALPYLAYETLDQVGEHMGEVIGWVASFRKAAIPLLDEFEQTVGVMAPESKALVGLLDYANALESAAQAASLAPEGAALHELVPMLAELRSASRRIRIGDDALEAVVSLDEGVHGLTVADLRARINGMRAEVDDVWMKAHGEFLNLPEVVQILEDSPGSTGLVHVKLLQDAAADFAGVAKSATELPYAVPNITSLVSEVRASIDAMHTIHGMLKQWHVIDDALEFGPWLEQVAPGYRQAWTGMFTALFDNMPKMIDKYDETWWIADSFSHLQLLADSGQDFKHQLDELVSALNGLQKNKGTKALMIAQGTSEEMVAMTIDDFIMPAVHEAESHFDAAMLAVDEMLPGPNVGGEAAVATLVDAGYEAQVMAAGTDELTTLVKKKITESPSISQPPSIAHFMTKEQKQDFLLKPYDDFVATHYAVEFKGMTLEGSGFETAAQKYAIKQGAPAKVAPTTATGVSKVTGQPTPIPSGIGELEKLADYPTLTKLSELASQKGVSITEDVFPDGDTIAAKLGKTLSKQPGALSQKQAMQIVQVMEVYDGAELETALGLVTSGMPGLLKLGTATLQQLDSILLTAVEKHGDSWVAFLASKECKLPNGKMLITAVKDGDISVAQLEALRDQLDLAIPEIAATGGTANTQLQTLLAYVIDTLDSSPKPMTAAKLAAQGVPVGMAPGIAGQATGTVAVAPELKALWGHVTDTLDGAHPDDVIKNLVWEELDGLTLEQALAQGKLTQKQITAFIDTLYKETGHTPAQAYAALKKALGSSQSVSQAVAGSIDIAQQLAPIPPGGPAWWAKPITVKQHEFLVDAKYALLPKVEGYTPGSLPIAELKGWHASQLIDGIKSGKVKTLDDAKAVLTGKPIPEAHDWIALSQEAFQPGDFAVAVSEHVKMANGVQGTIDLYTQPIPGVGQGKTWGALQSEGKLTKAHAQALADLADVRAQTGDMVKVSDLVGILAEPKYGKVTTTFTPVSGPAVVGQKLTSSQKDVVTSLLMDTVTDLDTGNYAWGIHHYPELGDMTLSAAIQDGHFTTVHLQKLVEKLTGMPNGSVSSGTRMASIVSKAISEGTVTATAAKGGVKASSYKISQFTTAWKAVEGPTNPALIAGKPLPSLGGKSLNEFYQAGDLTEEMVDYLTAKAQAGELVDEKYLDIAIAEFKAKQGGITATQAAAVEETVIAAPGSATTMGSAASGQAQKLATSAAPSHWSDSHTWTFVGDGSKWGGAHRKWEFVDEEGQTWMLKNGELHRAQGEEAAHRIAHMAGFDIAEGHATTQMVAGKKTPGFIQRMFPEVDGEFADIGLVTAQDLAKADAATLRAVQEQHVLDWLLGDHDSHAGNFIRLRDGRIVSVDHGQAFKFLGTDRLDPDWIPQGNVKNGAWTFQELWGGYRRGIIDLDLDAIDDALTRIEAMSDDALRAALMPYAKARFAAGSAGFLSGTTAKTAEEFVELFLARKRNIRKEFTEFYRKQAKARGIDWTPAWEKPATAAAQVVNPTIVNAGGILTPIDETFAEAVRRVGSSGRTVYVSGSEVERGQIMFDIVQDAQGHQILRVNAHLRPDAGARVMGIISKEGGASIAAQVPQQQIAANLPPRLAVMPQWNQKTIAAAKSVNYHIAQGDFTPNAGSLDALRQVGQEVDARLAVFRSTYSVRAGGDVVEATEKHWQLTIEAQIADGLSGKELDSLIQTAATEIAEAKGLTHFKPHVEDILLQGGKGSEAVKVQMFDAYDPQKAFAAEREALEHRYLAQLADAKKVQKATAPEKVFDKIERRTAVTSQVDISTHSTVARYEGIGSNYGNSTYHGQARIGGRQADVLYRDHTADHTQQGWLEIIMPTRTGEVTADDIQEAFDFIRDRLGVQTHLANVTEMELTYWRMVKGNYQQSREAADASSRIARALKLSDQKLAALPADPTPQQEIDAIRGAFREVFGTVIDRADVLPVHSRQLTETADEFGWGFWERPEVDAIEAKQAWDGRVLIHRTTCGDGHMGAEHFSDVAGHGGMALQERGRLGFKASAMSASADMTSGGASSFFMTPTQISSVGASNAGSAFVVNPVRRARRLLDYSANQDTYGRLEQRRSYNYLSVGQAAGQHGEWMGRDVVSYWDDVEIVFFDSDSARNAAVARVRARLGSGLWRGVPVEERMIGPSQLAGRKHATVVTDFFRRHGVDYSDAHLRRGVGQFTQSAGAVTKEQAVANLSRLKVKGGKLTKKLSTGQSQQVYVRTSSTAYTQKLMDIRIHGTENAISIGVESMARVTASWPGLEQVTAVVAEIPIGKAGTTGTGYIIDISPFGIDLKTMGKYERADFIRALLDALRDGTVDDLIRKYNPAYATV